ncbi:SAM-dependent methyltransferase [Rhodoligotrophos appendicifer]|uniref:class I SAM-dependent methyltransferase n=1 Tax=Rhodoligotrophos appendicifer TaxID=987056 RepID=UPI00118676E4|nr:class I SAM-dependent methyltransferase [Rhodoligotrophos appendicifer]
MSNIDLHLDKLRKARERGLIDQHGLYGLQWGHPDERKDLVAVRDRFLWPLIHPDKIAVEIGPGGGRWTRYLVPCRTLYVVDLYAELLEELKRNFHVPNMVFIQNSGTDFPGMAPMSADLIFSYGTFVHFELPMISTYLTSIANILRPGGDVVLQYADKTKPVGAATPSFPDCDPARMAALVRDHGFTIVDQDDVTLNNSGIIRFTR